MLSNSKGDDMADHQTIDRGGKTALCWHYAGSCPAPNRRIVGRLLQRPESKKRESNELLSLPSGCIYVTHHNLWGVRGQTPYLVFGLGFKHLT